MSDRIQEIAEQFDNAELILVAEELGLSPGTRWKAVRITETIEKFIEKNGIPDMSMEDESSKAAELLEDYLFVAGWVDKSGQEETPKPTKLPVELIDDLDEFLAAIGVEKTPKCYTYARPTDPACKRCKIARFCAKERITGLPDCFGISYNPDDPECIECLEAAFCKRAIQSGG